MWQVLGKTIAVLLLVLVPLAWGLGVESVFARWRRRKAGRDESG